jgi:hypothetical protein
MFTHNRVHRCFPFLVLFVIAGLFSIIQGRETFGHDNASSQAQTFQLAKDFNGKMDPLLAVGLRMGEYALKKLGVQKYGVKVIAELNPEPPQSYMIDGLQIITGATFGNRQMAFTPAAEPKITFVNLSDENGKVTLVLAKSFGEKLNGWMKDWGDTEIVSLYIYTLPTNEDIFEELP